MSNLEGKSDRQLRNTVRACERTLERLASVDVAKAVREGRADSLLAEGERAVVSARAAKEELRRRGSEPGQTRKRLPASWTGLISTRKRIPSGAHPASAALQSVAAFGHRELTGAVLTVGRLSHEEGVALAALVKRLHVQDDRQELTSEERARCERLLGKCAGNENLFAERRRESAAQDKLSRLTKEAKKAALPKRVSYEEPVPAFIFQWLKNSREASWTVADVGMLVTVLGMFANEDASLVVGARFEKDGEALILVTPEDIVFRPDSNPHSMQGGAGQVNPAIALATLRRNSFIVVERGDGGFRIRLGERGKTDR